MVLFATNYKWCGKDALSENPEDLFYLLNHSQVEKITPPPASTQSEKIYSGKSSAQSEIKTVGTAEGIDIPISFPPSPIPMLVNFFHHNQSPTHR